MNSSTFDFLLEKGSKETYQLSYRVLGIKIAKNNYQYFITNLDESTFSKNEIKELYHMRWDIETSFRSLKYSLGLTNFHAKKVDHIKQEIYAKLIIYNYAQ